MSKIVDFSTFKCRCSAISKIMSNSRDNPQLTEKQAETLADYRKRLDMGGRPLTDKQKDEMTRFELLEKNKDKIILSDTCIDYLMEVYAWETEGMIAVGKEAMDQLAMRKGKECEAEGLKLLSEADGTEYKIHKERISNEFLIGEIDSYTGLSVYEAMSIADVKNSFDYPTFLCKIHKGAEPGQTEQLQGYGDITGAGELWVSNVLVTATEEMILDMQFRVARKMNSATTESPEFLAEWPKWEKSMRFDHMSAKKRTHKVKIEPFIEVERQKVYDRVKVCGDWLCNFHEKRLKL